MKKKVKCNKGITEHMKEEGTVITSYDMDNFNFEDFCKTLEESHLQERERRIQWEKDNQPAPPLTEAEITVHKRSDTLLGFYPMTKDMLLERIELLDNAWMDIDFNGGMTSTKNRHKMWMWYMGDDMTSEQLYLYYIREIKPYLPKK